MLNHVHYSVIHNSQMIESLNVPQHKNRCKNIPYICTIKYYKAIKNYFMKFVDNWMKLENNYPEIGTTDPER